METVCRAAEEGALGKILESPEDASRARAKIVEQAGLVRKQLLEEQGGDVQKAEAEFAGVIGEGHTEYVDRIKNGKGRDKLAGIIEMGLHARTSPVRYVILREDEIMAALGAATEEEIGGRTVKAAHRAGAIGEAGKLQVAYAILKKGKGAIDHYNLGAVTDGRTTRAVFQVGQEAEEARTLIVKHIQSRRTDATAAGRPASQ
jgi:hypothetical protein